MAARAPQTRARRAAASRGVRALNVGILFVTLMAVCGGAWSFWTSIGAGTGTGSTSSLSAPTSVTASSVAGTANVAVTWAAPASGVTPTGYRVVRTNSSTGSSAPACGSSASTPVTGTTCTDTSVADGTYRYSVVALRAGWTATSADSSPVTVQLTIATTTALTSSTNPSLVTQSVTLTATVTATSGTPTGTVVFRDGATAVSCTGGSQTLGSGTATCVVAFASAGTRQLTATYAGSATFGASTSSAVGQVVNQQSQSVSFTSAAPTSATVAGATYAVSATSTSGLAVSFTSGTGTVCTLSGTTVTFVGGGTCTVLADQPGNAVYAAATQRTQSFSVAKAAQTISFTQPAAASAGTTAALVGTSTSGLAVTFTSTSPVCTVSGTTVTYVAGGTCTLVADQGGSAAYLAATSVTRSVAVSGAPLAPQNAAIVANSPSVGMATATWTAISGYTYECQVTNGSSPFGDNKWAACTTPYQFSAKNGTSTLYVRAKYQGLYSSNVTIAITI